MKIKDIQLSAFVLFSLVILSFAFYIYAEESLSINKNIFLDTDQDGLSDEEEKLYGTNPRDNDTDKDGYSDGTEVKGGYNPTKPAPGDKIITASKTKEESSPENNKDASLEKNLTKEIAKKISAIVESDNPDDKEISAEEMKSLVAESLEPKESEDDFPEVDPSEIKIKKQNYGNLSEEKAKEKKKEDFTNYIVGMYYILSSNSPEPITSARDITAIANSLFSQISSAILTRNPESLKDLASSGQKILEQMKDIEVPEELADMHIKGLRFAKYAVILKDSLSPKKDDPMADIANLSKIQAFVENIINFSNDAQKKFTEYGLQYDDAMRNQLKNQGLLAPEPGELIPFSMSSEKK